MREISLNFLKILFFAALTALGSVIYLPFLPYHPFTLQIFFPLLAGAFLGKEEGSLSQIIYVFLGVLGLPFFNLLGPGFPSPYISTSSQTGWVNLKAGYLLGFIAAAHLVGKTIEENKLTQFMPLLLTMFSGVILIYLMGLSHFRFVLGIPLSKSFYNWALPFFLLDLVKATLAALFFWRVKSRLAFPGRLS